MRPALLARQAPLGFECPLRGRCLTGGQPFGSFRAANQAAARYGTLVDADARERYAAQLYQRFIPMVRKTLRRFCSTSRCYPGGCLTEDLLGESYLAFREALDRFDPAYRVDFVGYMSQRLFWALDHRARHLRALSVTGSAAADPDPHAEEDRALNRVMAAQLLADVSEAEADLLVREAAGHTDRELAEAAGVSAAAMRKRLERLRRRLREGRRRA